MPNAAAIGAVTKRLVAVMMTSVCPRAQWFSTSAVALGVIIASIFSRMKRACQARSVSRSLPASGRRANARNSRISSVPARYWA